MSDSLLKAAISERTEEFAKIFRQELLAGMRTKKEEHTMKVSYNGFTGELVKLERKPDMKMFNSHIGYIYDLSIYDSGKQVTHSFAGVKLEDVKFLGGAVSFGG